MEFTFNFSPRPRHVFAADDSIFVSPNSSTLPPRPTVPTIGLPNNPLPSESSILRWSTDTYPYLPYCLQSPRYSGPLLQRLSYRASNIPVKCVDGMWRLCPKVVQQWQSLEKCLISATKIIFTETGVTGTQDHLWFRTPAEYLYQQQFDTHRRMVGCTMRSRDTFVPLMAICSYVISCTPNFTHSPPPRSAMLRAKGLHPEWVNMLETSQLADFSEHNKRVGVFVLPTCGCLQNIDRMLRANVPVWFFWDNRMDFRNNQLIHQRYCPTTEEVCQARIIARKNSIVTEATHDDSTADNSATVTCIGRNDSSTVTCVAHDSSVTENSFVIDHLSTVTPNPSLQPGPSTLRHRPQQPQPENCQYPKPDQFSDQRRGETMDQFFERRTARQAKMENEESMAVKQAWLDRKQEAELQHCPGLRSSARVFVWEDVDGFLMRTHVIKAAVEDHWGDYSPSQWRYNGFFNEWDLAIQFDSGAVADGDDDGYDGDYDFYGVPTVRPSTPLDPPPPYPTSPPPLASNVVFTDDVITMYAVGDGQYTNEASNTNINTESVDTQNSILYHRYGFNWDGVSTYAPRTAVPDWNSTQKTLTDSRNMLKSDMRVAVAHFVDYIVHNEPVPAIFSDLDDQNPTPLCKDFNQKLSVQSRRFNKSTYYFIQSNPPSSTDPPWDLVVEDPLTALECYRRDFGRLVIDIAVAFLHTGTPFSTRIQSDWAQPTVIHPHRHEKHVGLGWRQKGYAGDTADYAANEALRTEFLGQPRARSACLKGGIVWRLAKHSVELGVTSAGPSDDVFDYGSCIVSDSGGLDLWDDDLSEDELNLICGVYRVKTQGNQTSDSSWWPKHSVWMNSGLNVGYWSPACENWFQLRLDTIRAGTARLRTSTEWKAAL